LQQHRKRYFNILHTTLSQMFEEDKPLLERFYLSTENRGSFPKLLDLLGTMAEAESYKGKKKYSTKSSAAGIFHFLVSNGGGYNKSGQRVKHGAYNVKGLPAGSSFQTAQNRLRRLMANPKYADKLTAQGLEPHLAKVLEAKTPDDLNNEEQAMLAYANLKMKSDSLGKYLKGQMTGADLYAKEWVTTGSKNHSKDGINSNWKNALIRMKQEDSSDHASFFFGSQPLKQASPSVPEGVDPSHTPRENTPLRPKIIMTADGPVSLSPELYDFQPNMDEVITTTDTIDGKKVKKTLYRLGGVIVPSNRTVAEAVNSIRTKSTLI